ncbi:Stp1/IreP family PP2C-type Ser/Thr phosphatase [Orenia marismortui]|uniref:Protein phosphatase n=1 Tax=Orenia marismortui TaxID=46469 RepID=A0A4R8H280_9FIRM|nr:Stp1/IreP family PP2C-type Ser/Thr phosphatase [Orenia marismortui]TDX49201.1 protein phosphatase [Orenia marismortui]
MKYVAASEKGKVRNKNEDKYLALNKQDFDIIAVADGMGGHKGGDIASSLAVQRIKNYNFNSDQLKEDIITCIELANKDIKNKSLKDEECQGMGTTLTLGVIKDRIITIGHIGDSRAYLFRNQQLTQLTEDHSYVGELLRKNIINKEEAKNHPKKNLLMRSLGIDNSVEVDLLSLELKSEDLILICSDGLTNMLSDKEIEEILSSEEGLKVKVEKMIFLANQEGGYDNITVVIYKSN